MMKNTISLAILLFSYLLFGQLTPKEEIHKLLDSWHMAAAEANFEVYFSKMSSDAVFIGTDATENWQNKEFKQFSKPYFDRGKAWSFKALERNVYISDDKNFAWFDELLDTQMKLCRGSGVVKNVDGQWKIIHYVLSITVPNANVDELVIMKQHFDNNLIEVLKKGK